MSYDPVQEKYYNVRAAIPDHMDVFVKWREASDAYKAACPGARLDLAYGDGISEKLDFFPAKNNIAPAPLVMLIHGGYWQAMDKADNAFGARALNDAGVGVAVVNYALCPNVTLGDITQQMCQTAVWLWRNANALGADPDRLFAFGHSAGGHLAAMMMCADWAAIDPNIPADLFKGGLAISGLFDLTQLVETSINDKVGLSWENAKLLSPVNHAPASGHAFVAAVGGDESVGFHDQAESLRQAWAPHGVDVEPMAIPGCNHLQAFEALADPNTDICKKALSMI